MNKYSYLYVITAIFSLELGVSTEAVGQSVYTPLSFPGASLTQPNGINDLGQVVGLYINGDLSASNWTINGFMYSNGVYSTLNVPGATASDIIGINNSGQMVGNANIGQASYSFLYAKGVYTPLSFPGASLTQPNGINDLGQVVGLYVDGDLSTSNWTMNGFTYSNGVYSTLNVPGATASDIIGVNNSGQMVGNANIGQVSYSFLYYDQGLATPEASSWTMMLTGFAGLGLVNFLSRRRNVTR